MIHGSHGDSASPIVLRSGAEAASAVASVAGGSAGILAAASGGDDRSATAESVRTAQISCQSEMGLSPSPAVDSTARGGRTSEARRRRRSRGQQAKRRCADGQHRRQGETADEIAKVGRPPPQHFQHARQQNRQQRELPERVQQRPADAFRRRRREDVGEKCHGFSPFAFRTSCCISRTSSIVTRSAESRLITSFFVLPSKTRSARSSSRFNCVCSFDAAAA